MNGRISDPGKERYHPGVRRDLAVAPRDNSRRALVPGDPASCKPENGVGVSTPCGAVSTLGVPVFVPGLLKL